MPRKRKSDEVQESGIGVLKLKLGACVSEPSKRMAADFHAACADYNRACNAAVRMWERWSEDNPEAVSGKIMAKPKATCPSCGGGKDKDVKGQTVRHQKKCSKCGVEFVRSMEQLLFAAAKVAAPRLNTSIVSAGCREVMGNKQLNKRMPWSHRGTAKMVWQGVVRYEQARPCYREKRIPVLCNCAELNIDKHGVVTATIPLLSRGTGRAKLSVTCRIETRQLPPGQKAILHKVIAGDWKFCDSELVWHERTWLHKRKQSVGGWFLHMVFKQPRQPLGLDVNRTCTLSACANESSNPFAAVTDGRREWKLGEVATLMAATNYAEQKRMALRRQYDMAGSRRGHGRQRIEAGIRPVSLRLKDLASGFLKNLVSECIRYCVRFDCGTLMYMEPSIRSRSEGWFPAKKLSFDWTEFMARLKHKCWVNGITLKVETAKKAAVEKKKPDAETASG